MRMMFHTKTRALFDKNGNLPSEPKADISVLNSTHKKLCRQFNELNDRLYKKHFIYKYYPSGPSDQFVLLSLCLQIIEKKIASLESNIDLKILYQSQTNQQV